MNPVFFNFKQLLLPPKKIFERNEEIGISGQICPLPVCLGLINQNVASTGSTNVIRYLEQTHTHTHTHTHTVTLNREEEEVYMKSTYRTSNAVTVFTVFCSKVGRIRFCLSLKISAHQGEFRLVVSEDKEQTERHTDILLF